MLQERLGVFPRQLQLDRLAAELHRLCHAAVLEEVALEVGEDDLLRQWTRCLHQLRQPRLGICDHQLDVVDRIDAVEKWLGFRL